MAGRIAFALIVSICSGALAQSVRTATDTIDAATATLVRGAAEADSRGNQTLRDTLLREALAMDSDNPLARWQSGQVEFDGQWRSLEEVRSLATTDRRREEYRELVADDAPNPLSHEALARWCQRHDLQNEARWHWLNVMTSEPDHPAALKQLGFERYEGELYKASEIAALKEAKRNLRTYAPAFNRLVRTAERRDGAEREALLDELAAVDDAAAIPALTEAVRIDEGSKWRLEKELGKAEAEEFIHQLHGAAIDALSNMQEFDATVKLVEVAVLSPYEDVRRRAAEALIPREKTDYMPLMMDGLEALLELSVRIDASEGGTVKVVEELFEAGQEVNRARTRTTDFQTAEITRESDGQISVEYKTDEDREKASDQIRKTQAWVEAENDARRTFNQRVEEALQTITGLALGSDAEAWWANWQSYNDYDASTEKPLIEIEEYASNFDREYLDEFQTGSVVPECFVAGTPVWTQQGPTPIEDIEPGTLVLSQDPITGKLDYRPVVQTTTRQPTPVVRIATEGEELITTSGHRFWVSGDGWRMAKFLRPGERVHGLNGSTEVMAIESSSDAAVYNLVVDDFHTFFVGNQTILVHDVELPQPTTNTLPGVAPLKRATAKPQIK